MTHYRPLVLITHVVIAAALCAILSHWFSCPKVNEQIICRLRQGRASEGG